MQRRIAFKVESSSSSAQEGDSDHGIFESESQMSLMDMIDVKSETDRRLLIGILNRDNDLKPKKDDAQPKKNDSAAIKEERL